LTLFLFNKLLEIKMKKNKKDYNLRLLEERKRSKYLND
jgi:hypothetical protein